MLAEPIAVTLKVISVLERLEIPYLVGGSLASAIYGEVRATMDADLIVEVKAEQVQPLVAWLEGEFYIDAGMVLDAIQHASSFNLVHYETLFKVDLFIAKQRTFDQAQMQRRVSQVVGEDPEVRAYFSTPEDTILAKLEWFRMGGEVSERQWRDILGVLRLQGDRLDYGYLKEMAASLGVEELLGRALRDAETS